MRGERAHPTVRAAILRFAAWLRTQFEFPQRVPVYLLRAPTVLTVHGTRCTASFFAPFDRRVEPYVRIATGDFVESRRRYGRDDALAGYLCSFAHEIIHYLQWLHTGRTWERRVAERSERLVDQYARTVDHP